MKSLSQPTRPWKGPANASINSMLAWGPNLRRSFSRTMVVKPAGANPSDDSEKGLWKFYLTGSLG